MKAWFDYSKIEDWLQRRWKEAQRSKNRSEALMLLRKALEANELHELVLFTKVSNAQQAIVDGADSVEHPMTLGTQTTFVIEKDDLGDLAQFVENYESDYVEFVLANVFKDEGVEFAEKQATKSVRGVVKSLRAVERR